MKAIGMNKSRKGEQKPAPGSGGIEVEREYFLDLREKSKKNYMIADLYEELFEESAGKEALKNYTYKNWADTIRACCKVMDVDYYRMQAVKDIKRINLCKNKFCFNCQSMMALKRQAKYSPELDELYRDFAMFHFVLTVPNCPGSLLKPTIDNMYVKFKHLTRFLSGDKRIRGMDFGKYGYAGAVRGTEINKSREREDYHPHFHCILLLRKGFTLKKTIVNTYSYDKYGSEVRRFSELEIQLQKIWYLLINGIEVNKSAVDNLKLGYSSMLDPIRKGEYHEVFKYVCKGLFDEEEGAQIYNREVFRTLREALYGRRAIQGYGILHNFKDDVGEIVEADVKRLYEERIRKLSSFEKPVFVAESLDAACEERNCKYISKSSLKRDIMSRMTEARKNDQ